MARPLPSPSFRGTKRRDAAKSISVDAEPDWFWVNLATQTLTNGQDFVSSQPPMSPAQSGTSPDMAIAGMPALPPPTGTLAGPKTNPTTPRIVSSLVRATRMRIGFRSWPRWKRPTNLTICHNAHHSLIHLNKI